MQATLLLMKRYITLFSMYIGILVVLFASFQNSACAETQFGDIAIMKAANEWQRAIITKDIDMLVSFALPEDKENVKRLLADKNTELYGYFFGSQRSSFHNYMNAAKKLTILVIKQRSVYYYDEEKVKTIPTENPTEIQQLVTKGEILAFYFFEIASKWYVSFEFGNEDY